MSRSVSIVFAFVSLVAIGCGTSRVQPPIGSSSGGTIADGLSFGDTGGLGDVSGTNDAGSADGGLVDAGASSDGAAPSDIGSKKDAGGCAIGSSRCAKDGKKGREICTATGWKAAPCDVVTPTCVDGKCLVCKPDAVFCGEKADKDPYAKLVLKCDGKGGAATTVKTCKDGPCQDGKCLACPPGAYRCNKGKREVCAGGGILWSPDHCPIDKPACLQGKCVPCIPSSTACGKDAKGQPAIMQCDAAGTKLTFVSSCKAGEVCSEGQCVTCKTGDTKCLDEGTFATCKADGSGFAKQPCPADKPVCAKGKCQLCKAGKTFCQEGSKTAPEALMQCDATGQKATIKMACPAGKKCNGTGCSDCVPGKLTCLGEVPLLCNANGTGFAANPSCAKKNLLCGPKACSCPAGANFCGSAPMGLKVGRAIMACDGAGKVAKKASSCAVGQHCAKGKCVACLAGSKACAGSKVLTCKADGSGFQLGAPCSGNATCVQGQCVDVCGMKTGNPTARGCRFWAVDLDNAKVTSGGKTLDAQNAPFSIAVVNPNSKTVNITVRLGPGPGLPLAKLHKFSVGSMSSAHVTLPVSAWKMKPANQDGTSIAGMAYRVDSDAAVQVWQFNPLKSAIFSSESTMLLPANGLGTNHRVVGRKQSLADLRAYVAVAATESGTTKLEITPTAAILKGKDVPDMAVGKVTKLTLQQGQVLNLETAAVGGDLTGTKIVSDKPVAVFSGSEAAHAPNTDVCVTVQDPNPAKSGKFCAGTKKVCGVDGDCPQTCCADHIEEQLPPLWRWGKVYAAPRFQPRGSEPDTFRIIAAQDSTTVVVEPPVVPARGLKAGESFEFTTDKDIVIEATAPIAVGQFMASKGLTGKGVGDPAFVMLSPVKELPKRMRFRTPAEFSNHFVLLASPVGEQVKVDGAIKKATVTIGASGWEARRVKLSAGVHSVESSGRVTAVLHGWSTDASYAHLVGFSASAP